MAIVLNPDQVAGLITEWATARNNQFRYNWVVSGGWEGWVQVDLIAFTFSRYGTDQIDALREQAIFEDARKRVDILYNPDIAPYDRQIPVEIKAQSFNNANNFVPGLDSDVDKITFERNDNYQDSDCFVLGIAATEEGLRGMQNIERDGDRIFNIVFNNGEVAVGLAFYDSHGNGWVPAVN